MLYIGIIGGLLSIDLVFDGAFIYWIIVVIFFCGLGEISLALSRKETREAIAVKCSKAKSTVIQKGNLCMQHLKHYAKTALNYLREQTAKTDHLYFKIILTAIAIFSLIIAVKLNHVSQGLKDLRGIEYSLDNIGWSIDNIFNS